jgi:DNA-binding MarR family transcriptional regulator
MHHGTPTITSGGTTLGTELYRSLAGFRREVRRAVRSEFPAQLLTPSQVEVLGCVRRRPGIGVRDAAAALRLAPNTVSTIVGQLVEIGFLRREPDPDDARAVCLRLTAAGHRRVHAWRDRSTQTVDRALQSLDADERAALARALPAFRHLVDVIAAGTPSP